MEGTVISLLPPLAAIVLCVLLREAVISLFLGVLLGAFLIYGYNPIAALYHSVDEIILTELLKANNAINLIYVVLIGGFVEIMNRSVYTRYWIASLANLLRNRRNAGATIWGSGMLLFVDDYANSLIVGYGFRKLVDRVRISREKLAFIVDTTSAPITSIAIISTWIGFEITTIQNVLDARGFDAYTGYGLFFTSIPYRFYPILILFFCLMIAYTGRDYGPMRKVEERTMREGGTGSVDKDDDETLPADMETPHWSSIAVFAPFALLTFFTLFFLTYTGIQAGAVVDYSQPWETLKEIFNEADAYRSILYSTLIASVFSYLIHLALLRESFTRVYDAWMGGCKAMFPICMILLLAWSIGSVCSQLKTDEFIASMLGADFDPTFLPAVTFICAAVISFSTGTSFGTMSILIPIVVPIVLPFAESDPSILNATVGSILGGAIFGDHCSPISDTTILSSAASGCSVTAHVSTQLPYALTAAAAATVCLMSVGFMPAFVLNIAGIGVLAAILFAIGRAPDPYLEASANR